MKKKRNADSILHLVDLLELNITNNCQLEFSSVAWKRLQDEGCSRWDVSWEATGEPR